MTIRIVTDSTCDLPQDIINLYGIQVLPLFINVGKEGYLDGVDITREEFYQKLPDFPTHPTTAVPSPQKFRAVYNALAEEGADEIISIHISVTLSAVVDVARTAAGDTTSTQVTVVDGGQLSLGTGFLVETAAKMAANGATKAEILSAIENQKARTHVFAGLDTLEFLKRSGRMNSFVTTIGTLLQLKPILTMFNGKAGVERVRTKEKATRLILQMVEELGAMEKLAIVHTHALQRAAELRNLVSHIQIPTELLMVDITPVIGAHIGPGAAGFAVVTAK